MTVPAKGSIPSFSKGECDTYSDSKEVAFSETAQRILNVVDASNRLLAGESVADELGLPMGDLVPHLDALAMAGVIAPKSGAFWDTSVVKRIEGISHLYTGPHP
jgi:hypothetical protein